jgi:hypothetical protein
MNLINNTVRLVAFAALSVALAPGLASAQICEPVIGGFQPPTFVRCDPSSGFVSADGPTDTVRALLQTGVRVRVTGRDQNNQPLYPGSARCTVDDVTEDGDDEEDNQCQDNGAKIFSGVIGQAFAS